MKINSLNKGFQISPRTGFGLFLIAVSLVAAFILTGAVGAKANFYVASKVIAAGETFTLNNLKVAQYVSSGLDGIYLKAGSPILGKVATHNFLPGNLIDGSGISDNTSDGFQIVALSATRNDFPLNLIPGDQVDLYVLPNSNDGGSAVAVKRILTSATVLDIDTQSSNLGGAINFTIKVSSSDLTGFFTALAGKELEVVKNAK
jgi:hypothetical protein